MAIPVELASAGSWHARTRGGATPGDWGGVTRHLAFGQFDDFLSGRHILALEAIEPIGESRMSPLKAVVHCDPEVMSGTPVFLGTRVPVRNLIDYLAAGQTVDEFLDDFPTLSRQQALAVLHFARETLVEYARAA
jgi:uncharacterized protein (DUF433 family)